MNVLSEEKAKLLAEKNGWPLAWAEGYVDGETFRRRGEPPTIYAQIGIDEYSLGFRAGYYERSSAEPVSSASIVRGSILPMANVSAARPKELIESIDITTIPARSG